MSVGWTTVRLAPGGACWRDTEPIDGTPLGAINHRSPPVEDPRCGLLCIRHRVLMSRETVIPSPTAYAEGLAYRQRTDLNDYGRPDEPSIFLLKFYQFPNPTVLFSVFETRR
jgi:hypothetical protein